MHVDEQAEYDSMMNLAFSHPYLLHIILSISALHMLHSEPDNARLYEQASLHSLSAHRLARPRIRDCSPAHSNALYCFSGFASLQATAEPPLRTGSSKLKEPEHLLMALLDAFEMGRGVAAIMAPNQQQIESSGFLDHERWKVDEDDVPSDLEAQYPQISDLEMLIQERCYESQREPCLAALRLLFSYMAVLGSKPLNHSTTSLIQRWPMDIDGAIHSMAREYHSVALIILAYYAVLMHCRRNYWFFNRWPNLIFDAIDKLIPLDLQEYLEWPREALGQDLTDGIGT